MRTCFNSAYDVAHLWAHQKQEEAHCGKNFYFRGDTIYSYGSHFPLGKIVSNQKGVKAYVLNNDHYSASTTNHQQIVRSSIPNDAIIFEVGGCTTPITVNGIPTKFNYAMEFIAKQLNEMYSYIEKQHRARSSDYRWGIVACINQIQKWIKYWQLDKAQNWRIFTDVEDTKRQPTVFKYWKDSNYDLIKSQCHFNYEQTATCICLFSLLAELNLLSTPLYGDNSVDSLLEKFFGKEEAERIDVNIKRAKIRNKRKINREYKIQLAKELNDIERWKSGEKLYISTSSEFLKVKGWDTALRVKDCFIQTSKDIKLSFEEGKRLWLLIKAFESGEKFHHDLAMDANQHQWKINSYHNHVLTAGCHNIPFSECERIAKIMNWQ